MSVRGDSQVGKNATITGYPKQVQNYSNSYQMWTHTNNVTKLQIDDIDEYSNGSSQYSDDSDQIISAEPHKGSAN